MCLSTHLSITCHSPLYLSLPPSLLPAHSPVLCPVAGCHRAHPLTEHSPPRPEDAEHYAQQEEDCPQDWGLRHLKSPQQQDNICTDSEEAAVLAMCVCIICVYARIHVCEAVRVYPCTCTYMWERYKCL